MRQIMQATCILAAAAGPAAAAMEWQQTVMRGLETYTLSNDGQSGATLLCDPNRVFGGTSNASLVVTMPNDPDPSVVVLLASTGEQAALQLVDGRAIEKDTDPVEWLQMVEIIRGGGTFAFVTGDDAMQFDGVASLPDLAC